MAKQRRFSLPGPRRDPAGAERSNLCAAKISRSADPDDRAISSGRPDRHHGAVGGAGIERAARAGGGREPAGGGSTIGTKSVAAADPDGYTLLFGSSGSLAVAPALYSSLGIDPLKAFAPVATVALLPHVFVENVDVPAKTLGEFVAYAKANPGKLNYGAGLGTPPHLLSTLFKTQAKIDVVYIPYTGSAQSINDLLGGRTQFTIDGLTGLYP